ncbi:MAG: hypothetical protein U0Q07_03335 [Acidimicrobiales bacterium]
MRSRPSPASAVAATAVLLATATIGAAASASSAAVAPAGAPAATATVSGDAMHFGLGGGPVPGGAVTVLERPDLTTTTDADGHWVLDGLVVGDDATFVLTATGRPVVQTATFTVPAGGLERVAFQSPDDQIFAGFAQVLRITPDPTRCQVASTVTRRGHSVYGPAGSHGEPGAVAWIDPAPASADGPVYFNLIDAGLIWPDRSLDRTTDDGGVVWTNVSPGTYTLRASLAGADIAPARITCRPGVLVNASPPWGLQVVAGGLEPDAPYPTTTTTTAVPSTVSSTVPSIVPAPPPSAAAAPAAGGGTSGGAPSLTPAFAG